MNDKYSIPMYFESDLITPRPLTIWRESFEWWWIRKSFHDRFGTFCMNCEMEKKEGIILEITQIIPKRETYKDLVNLENYQILCRACNSNRSRLKKNDCRPENWPAIVSTIPDIFSFPEPNYFVQTIDIDTLQKELKENHIKADQSELSREIRLSRLISTCHHAFINKAASDTHFVARDNKFNIYLKLLLMRFENLKKLNAYSHNVFSEVYQLHENPIRKYLIDNYGGISKTSIVYAMTKYEHSRSSFLNCW
jgi:hypothetical protein